MEYKNKNSFKFIVAILLVILLAIGVFFGYRVLTNNKSKSEPTNDESSIAPLLYEVTKEGSTNKMYLLGSIHAANKDDLVFPDYVLNAYNNSHYLACEFDIVEYNSNQEKVLEEAMKLLYQDGTTIKDHLSEKTYNNLISFLEKKNAYVNLYEQYKPLFFVSLLENLMAQDAKIDANSGGVDNYFESKAHQDNKTILEVESYDYQIGLFDEFSDELYDLIIDDTLEDYENSINSLQGLYNAWKNGNASDILKYGADDFEIKDSYTDKQKKIIEDYNKKLVDNRNDEMLKKAIEYFDTDKDVFFMVGVLHIVGDNGLAKGLEENGFNVRQVK